MFVSSVIRFLFLCNSTRIFFDMWKLSYLKEIMEKQIKEIKVLLTLVGGKPVYVGPEFSNQVSPMLN